MARLGDNIREECRPVGKESGKFSLVGVSNEHGLVSSPRETAADNLSRYQRVERDWFAYNPMRVNIGSIGLADEDSKTGITSPDYVVFSCREGLDPRFLLQFLKSDYGLEAIARNCSGAVRKRLYYSGLAEIELTIPDIQRQQALITRIEHIQQGIRFIRDENSDRHELPKLKQAILQEAIAGKLTADWRAAHPDVEPASQLLHGIQAERARLIAAKKLRPEKPLPKITPAEVPFEIPKGWEWCRLGEVVILKSGNAYSYKQTDNVNAVPYIKVGDMNIDGNRMDAVLSSTYYDYASSMESQFITPKSIIFPKRGGAIATNKRCKVLSRPILVDSNTMAMVPLQSLYFDFVFIWFSQIDLAKFGNTNVLPQVNNKDILPLLFPLPPLAEQPAIVARVEALMEHCRALGAEIAHTRTHAAHLLQAVLKEAFAPAS